MRAWWILLPCIAACTSRRDPAPTVLPDVPPPQARAKMNPTEPAVKDLGADEPLEAGVVRWEGMVRPTKGGYDVRGVTLDDNLLEKKLQESAIDGLPADRDWFLGAVVRVTGELERIEHEPPQDGGLAVQTRAGVWFSARQVRSVELVRRAQEIEGTLQRSKGMWSVDRYLINHRDLEWALVSSGGSEPGKRVRIWGQPKVVRCDPRAQCLIEGELPLFEVGRARVVR